MNNHKNHTGAITDLSYDILIILAEWHFDIFGLIAQGAAKEIES